VLSSLVSVISGRMDIAFVLSWRPVSTAYGLPPGPAPRPGAVSDDIHADENQHDDQNDDGQGHPTVGRGNEVHPFEGKQLWHKHHTGQHDTRSLPAGHAVEIMGAMGLEGRKVRRAEAADAADLVRLRAQMLADMGRSAADGADPWQANAEVWFADRLTREREFAAFVVDDPGDGVVACSAGICDFHAPGPRNLTGVRGHVFNMSTLPAHRSRGYARACLEALLEWFRDETAARVINLNATQDGIALYRSMGFSEPRFAALQLILTESRH